MSGFQTLLTGLFIEIARNMIKAIRLKFIPLFLIFLGFLFATTHSIAAEVSKCENLFGQTLNKYEILAEELGLNYIKSPIPDGYKRSILSSRTYSKKDSTDGKTIYYYRYFRPDGSIIRPKLDAEEHKQIVANFDALKPDRNWDDVWLSTDENSHIQLLAKNSRGENVAIYHQEWGEGASKAKFLRVQKFGNFIASIRKGLVTTLQDSSLEISHKQKVEAAALMLLMSGRIRVGDVKYLDENGTTGVTTLRKDQVISENGQVFLKYIGKSGNKNPEAPNYTTIEITQSELKKTILELREAHPEDPRLLIYDSRGQGLAALSPQYLNRRLREMTKSTSYSVKDLRTWAATVKTVQELVQAGRPPQNLTRTDAILKTVAKNVSRLLNNTPGVARKDYIDPRILNPDAYQALWNLCENKFPILLQIEKSSIDSFAVEYNTEFENLALTFLSTL